MIPILLACAGPPVDTAGGDVDGDEQELVPFEYVSTDDDWAYVSTGGGGICGIRTNGSLECWGGASAAYSYDGTDSGQVWQQVHVSFTGVCALDAAGHIQCWDSDPASPLSSEIPMGGYVSLAAAYNGACAIDGAGILVCWGGAWLGVPAEYLEPPDGEFVSASIGPSAACAIASSGEALCWPATYLDDEDWTPSVLPGPYQQVEVGALWGMVLHESGETTCWSSSEEYERFCMRPSDTLALQISLGENQSCALLDDHAVECWGSERATSPSGRFLQVDAGVNDSCGLRDDGRIACWGTAVSDGADSARPP